MFTQKTAYEMRISDWSSGVCSSDLPDPQRRSGVVGWHFQVRRRNVPHFHPGALGGCDNGGRLVGAFGSVHQQSQIGHLSGRVGGTVFEKDEQDGRDELEPEQQGNCHEAGDLDRKAERYKEREEERETSWAKRRVGGR